MSIYKIYISVVLFMGCTACAKKRRPISIFTQGQQRNSSDPSEWGPILWKILHCIVEKIAPVNNPTIHTDQAIHMQLIINNLPFILPCETCQEHARAYIGLHRPTWGEKRGDDLRNTIREWLFSFHNHVRTINGQPIIIQTVQDCAQHYANCTVTLQDISGLIDHLSYASTVRIIQPDTYKKWMTYFNRLRVLCNI